MAQEVHSHLEEVGGKAVIHLAGSTITLLSGVYDNRLGTIVGFGLDRKYIINVSAMLAVELAETA